MTTTQSVPPRVFIASSSEQMAVARNIAQVLCEQAMLDVRVWDQLFEFSATYIESLESELDRADFAVVVLTGDDAANVRAVSTVLPRDNVLFELGLFIGRLGRPRCFFFVDAASGTQIASDLSGVKAVSYHPDQLPPDPRKPTLHLQATQVARQMGAIGEQAVRYKPTAQDRERQEAQWRFSCRLSGHWWERMVSGDDDASALSLLRIDVDPLSLAPTLDGRAFGLDLEPLAEWHSAGSTVVPGERPKLYYRWEGSHDAAIGQIYGGHGVVTFADSGLQSAEGYFFDTNFAHITTGAPTRVKRFRMVRCIAADAAMMQQPRTAAARRLLARKVKELG